MDAVHAVEFDLEDVPSAPVGSLLAEGINEGGGFQRIADEEDAAPTSRHAPQIKAAHVDHFVDDVAPEVQREASFQRVSDDEEGQTASSAAETVAEQPAKTESAAKRRKRSGVIGRLFKSKKSEEDENESARAVDERAGEQHPEGTRQAAEARNEPAGHRGPRHRGGSYEDDRMRISA